MVLCEHIKSGDVMQDINKTQPLILGKFRVYVQLSV